MGEARRRKRLGASLSKLKGAVPDLIATATTQKTSDSRTQEVVRKHFFSHPSSEFTVKEVQLKLGLKKQTAGYHVQALVKSGALERMPGFKYRANALFKNVEQVRSEIAALESRVELSTEHFAFGQANGITAGTNWVYFRRHCDSIRQRMEAEPTFTSSDVDAFDELMGLAFGRRKSDA